MQFYVYYYVIYYHQYPKKVLLLCSLESGPLTAGLYVQFYLLIYVQGLGGLLYHYVSLVSVPLKQGLL